MVNDDLIVEPSDELFNNPPPDDIVDPESFTQADPNFLKAPKRKPYSVQYENKVKGALNGIMRGLIQTPATVPDAATIIMYGPSFSYAMGNWAADDDRVKRAIDFITSGTENPALMAFSALFPMVLQILRNHEPQVEAEPRRIRIPFTKKYIRLRFKIKLGQPLRNYTNEPKEFAHYVLSNEAIQEQLRKSGIHVASMNGYRK